MRTKRDDRLGLVLSVSEKSALRMIAEREGDSQAAIIRRLLRLEAEKRGLWPIPSTPRPTPADAEVRP